MFNEIAFSPSDNDEETNRKYYELENRKQIFYDELHKTRYWKIVSILSVKRRIRTVNQAILDFKWNHGLILHVCILDL
jgi:hypothetical protein